MKLAGEFESLGFAKRGESEFDAPPPEGVVKLYYLDEDLNGGELHNRCGFFECPWWRWGAFKEAATRHQPSVKAQGNYPNASIIRIAD
jgi:hypothetical protein